MQSYTKLFQELIYSSVWVGQPVEKKVLWVTILALKSPVDQIVRASVPGLAAAAGISLESCRGFLAQFMDKDPDSRSKEHDGRRLQEVDGGWLVLNGQKYQHMMMEEQNRERWARNKRAERDRKRGNGKPTKKGAEGKYQELRAGEAAAIAAEKRGDPPPFE